MPVRTGVVKAVRHFKDKDLKQSTVRDWRNLYLKELRTKKMLAKVGKEVLVKTLTFKKRGRPPLLGVKLDKYLQQLISAMRSQGTPIGTNIVIATGRGILLKHSKSSLEENGGTIKLNKEWARSVLIRMGYPKRRACSKSKIFPEDLLQIQQQYLRDIKASVQLEDIPADLTLNWDQTAMKIVPAGKWTMDKKGSKHVKVVAIDDKRMITAVFANSLSGNFYQFNLYTRAPHRNVSPKMCLFRKIGT